MSPRLQVIIRGTGTCVPEHVVTNEHYASYLDTSNEWIIARTGIRERRHVRAGESTLTLARDASQRALQAAGITAADIDLIICCTATPELMLPATACLLQNELQAADCCAFDLAAACSGFVHGLIVAAHMIQNGAAAHALVVGAETLSRITDLEDRSTAILFGDGAGAAVLSRSPDPQRSILHYELGTDGNFYDHIWIPAGGSREPISQRTVNERLHYMRMRGRELFKLAVHRMQKLIDSALEATGHSPEDLKLIIPHQSNRRIIDSMRKRLRLAPEKVAVNIDRFGNTSSASVIIALDEARRAGKVGEGDLVMLVAFGAGVTWGSALLRL